MTLYCVCVSVLVLIVVVLLSSGQLSDLLHIIDSSGMPSSSNRYLFNGDFVDRGAYGVEVMCVLLALHASMPGETACVQCGQRTLTVSL